MPPLSSINFCSSSSGSASLSICSIVNTGQYGLRFKLPEHVCIKFDVTFLGKLLLLSSNAKKLMSFLIKSSYINKSNLTFNDSNLRFLKLPWFGCKAEIQQPVVANRIKHVITIVIYSHRGVPIWLETYLVYSTRVIIYNHSTLIRFATDWDH